MVIQLGFKIQNIGRLKAHGLEFAFCLARFVHRISFLFLIFARIAYIFFCVKIWNSAVLPLPIRSVLVIPPAARYNEVRGFRAFFGAETVAVVKIIAIINIPIINIQRGKYESKTES